MKTCGELLEEGVVENARATKSAEISE